MSDPWFKGYIGRDYMRDGRSWIAWFMFFPARSLMTMSEEGRLVLAGLSLELRQSSRFPFFSVSAHSDFDEITYRRAGIYRT